MLRALSLSGLLLLSVPALGQSRIDANFYKLSAESQRTIFITEYKELVERAAPSLNYIKTGLRKTKGGYFLYAQHNFLTKYSFDIGRLGPTVSEWVGTHGSKLKLAGIVKVGILTSDGDERWFHGY